MYQSVMQRESSSSLRLSYPRLASCEVAFHPGPRPIQPLRLHSPLVAHPPTYTADFTVESSLAASMRQRRERDESDAKERERRKREFDRKRAEEEEAAERERQRREDEERRETEDRRRAVETEQENLRAIADAYKRQRAAVESFNRQSAPSSSSSSSSLSSSSNLLPIAHPAGSSSGRSSYSQRRASGSSPSPSPPPPPSTYAGLPGVTASAVASFEGITGVKDAQSSALLLSLLDGNVDHAVNLYYSEEVDGAPSMAAAIEKAVAVQDRKRGQGI